MNWRVAIRPGKPGHVAQEVIDPEDWLTFSLAQQLTYESVNEFVTEQEAEKFAKTKTQEASAITDLKKEGRRLAKVQRRDPLLA
jgi:hypothetical protein